MHSLTIEAMHASIDASSPDSGLRVAALHERIPSTVARIIDRSRGASHELILVREIKATLELPDRATDLTLAEAWAGVLAEKVIEAIEQSSTTDGVVRYGSHMAAVHDVAAGLAAGTTSRGWAWKLAGVCSAVETPDQVAAGLTNWLAARPEAVPHIFNAQARAGRMGALLNRLGASHIETLGAACLALEGDPVRPAGPQPPPAIELDHGRVASTPIVVALLDNPGASQFRNDSQVRAALAAIILRGLQPAGRLSSRAVDLVAAILSDESSASQPRIHIEAPPIDPVADALATPDQSPSRTESDGRSPELPASARSGESSNTPDSLPDASVDGAIELQITSRRAGILYLVNLLLEDAFFAAVIPTLPGRSLSWTLRQIGNSITGSVDDAAVAVFSGSLFDDEPDGDGPTTSELAQLARAVDEIAAELHNRLRGEGTPEEVLARVVCRSAVIEAVPGWAEATFDLDAIDIDVRIAGMDRDPGYVPYLGWVVRFAYA